MYICDDCLCKDCKLNADNCVSYDEQICFNCLDCDTDLCYNHVEECSAFIKETT